MRIKPAAVRFKVAYRSAQPMRHDIRLPSIVILGLDPRIHGAVFLRRWKRMKVAYSSGFTALTRGSSGQARGWRL